MGSPATLEWDSLLTAAHAWTLCPDDLRAEALERQCLVWLTPEERARREQLRTDRLRHLSLAARALCRATLSRYTGVDPAAWSFVEGAHGKPRVVGPGGFATLRFNLAHADGLVACLVTRAGEVGVDAEETSRPVDVGQVARHFLSAGEQRCLAVLPPERRAARFFEIWVLKEAYLKGRGTGLSQPPERVTIASGDDGQPLPVGNWQLALHRPTPRHVAATAVRVRRGAAPVPVTWFAADGLVPA